jgi:hypothetical protein
MPASSGVMAELLSLTVGVDSLLGVCLNVCIELKRFRYGAAQMRTTVTDMLTAMKALRQVRQSVEETFEQLDSHQSPIGHIGTLWTNLSTSLQDEHDTLAQFEGLLKDFNKDLSLLDQTHRQTRLKKAAEQNYLLQAADPNEQGRIATFFTDDHSVSLRSVSILDSDSDSLKNF